jgi:hypothetical protein
MKPLTLLLVLLLLPVSSMGWVVNNEFESKRVDLTNGRAGNVLLRTAFFYMMCSEFQKPFVNEALGTPECNAMGCPVSGVPPWHDFGLRRPPLANTTMDDHGMYHLAYFMPHRRYLRTHVFRPDPHHLRHDLVVHVRLDDIFNDKHDYTLLPLSVYARMLRNINTTSVTTAAVIGRALDADQREILHAVAGLLPKHWRVHVSADNSLETDLRIMFGARILFGSISTLWGLPAILSPWLREVHAPLFYGRASIFMDAPSTEGGVSFFTYDVGFHNKITSQEWRRRFYDL